MSRSRGGEHRHRQPWTEARCECCGLVVLARPTLPGHPWHVRAHFTRDAELCPCDTAETLVPV
jgi:hypothetical protein